MLEGNVDEDALNMQIRKFLKKVGITSQREIEQAVRQAAEAGKLSGGEKLKARVTLELPELGLREVIEGSILLD